MGAGSDGLAWLGEDVPIFEDSVGCVLFRIISFQGLLAEFACEEVCNGFLSGQFLSVDYSPAMLASLTKMRELMLPTLQPQLSASRSEMAVCGVKFFIDLLSKSENEPVDLNGMGLPVQKTFAEWFAFFHALSACSYWRKIPLDDLPPMLKVDVHAEDGSSATATDSSLSCRPKHTGIFESDAISGRNSPTNTLASSKAGQLSPASHYNISSQSADHHREQLDLLSSKLQGQIFKILIYSFYIIWNDFYSCLIIIM